MQSGSVWFLRMFKDLRFLWVCSILAGGFAHAANTAPQLIPQPREVHAGELRPLHSVVIRVPRGNKEDTFAAENLRRAFVERGLTISKVVQPRGLTVWLLRADTAEAKRLLAGEKLVFDPAMHDEGYVLISRPGSVSIVGATAAGVFYGAQTLKQMVENQDGSARIWTGVVRDWPAMQYRGVHDDLSRGPFPTLAFQKHQLEVFAAWKVNVYSPYFEHTLQYSDDPLAAPPGGSLTRAEARELSAWAQQLHITIVPEQEAFGHLHHRLKYEKYADVAETPHGHVIAPGQSGSLPLIRNWFTQIAQDFPGPFLHVGADETFELGTGRTKADVDQRGLGPVYADFLSSIHATLAPLHRRLLSGATWRGTIRPQ